MFINLKIWKTPGKLFKHILKYIVFFLINIITLNFCIYFLLNECKSNNVIKVNNVGSLNEKFEYYKQNKDSFNVLFVGDSRTYTNIHNEMLDSALKTRSYNHAVWANWFPTQYAFFVDLLPTIPDSTTLVFSMGYQNFMFGEIQETYPINKELLATYYNWGFSFRDIRNPVAFSNNYIHPFVYLEQKRHQILFNQLIQKYIAVLFSKHPKEHKLCKKEKTISKTLESERKKIAEKAKELNNFYTSLPQVNSTSINYQGDTITSLVVYWQKGNYWRIELWPEFFRSKQHESYLQLEKKYEKQTTFVADDRYWNNFKAIAELLGKHSKRLNIIVNEMEEALFCYKLSGRAIYDEFTKTKVLPVLKENNLGYIKVDVSAYPDSYYFDYNHLNNYGSTIYTQKFSEILKPYIYNR